MDRPIVQTLIPAIADDGSLFPVEKMDAHRRGLLHQAVSIFVFSGDDLLIQRRAAGKYHSGGQWANTCCSHPHWGESLQDAAERRLQEELGFGVALTPASIFTYEAPVGGDLIEHERVHVFRGSTEKSQLTLSPDPQEVADTRWTTPDTLRAEIKANPHDFAPWFRIYLERWGDLRL